MLAGCKTCGSRMVVDIGNESVQVAAVAEFVKAHALPNCDVKIESGWTVTLATERKSA